MNPLRHGLPPLPPRMRALPVSPLGYPVPFFVATVDGGWDFRVADPAKFRLCVRQELCWLCGQPLGVFRTFVLGPIAALNRISGEPPCHLECAEFAAMACPFLLLPKARRREVDGPTFAAGGTMLAHNPGVCALWSSKNPPRPDLDIGLLQTGEPTTVRWYCQGRPAARADVLEALDAGIESLLEVGAAGEAGRDELERRYQRLLPLLPKGE